MNKVGKITKSPSYVELIRKVNELAQYSTTDTIITIHEDTIASEDALKNIANPSIGDVYFVTGNDYAYIYLSSGWKPLAPVTNIVFPSDTELESMW